MSLIFKPISNFLPLGLLQMTSPDKELPFRDVELEIDFRARGESKTKTGDEFQAIAGDFIQRGFLDDAFAPFDLNKMHWQRAVKPEIFPSLLGHEKSLLRFCQELRIGISFFCSVFSVLNYRSGRLIPPLDKKINL